MLPAKRAGPRFFRETDAGRWSAPARSCRGCLFTLGITARRPREGSADGIFDRRSPRTRRPAGSRTSGGHLLLVVNPVRGPLASPFFFVTGARNELQSPPSIDRGGGPRTRSKDNSVQNRLCRLGDNRFQGWSCCGCGRQCNHRGQTGSFDHGTHGTRPSWGLHQVVVLGPTQRSLLCDFCFFWGDGENFPWEPHLEIKHGWNHFMVRGATPLVRLFTRAGRFQTQHHARSAAPASRFKRGTLFHHALDLLRPAAEPRTTLSQPIPWGPVKLAKLQRQVSCT